jgi:hypothetical protein
MLPVLLVALKKSLIHPHLLHEKTVYTMNKKNCLLQIAKPKFNRKIKNKSAKNKCF